MLDIIKIAAVIGLIGAANQLGSEHQKIARMNDDAQATIQPASLIECAKQSKAGEKLDI